MRATVLASLVLLAACGEEGHQPEPYGTYQACFDDHVEKQMRTVPDAIIECCRDHPIAGVKPVCGADRPECINYLTANLNQTSASTVEVEDTCQLYEDTRDMPQ